MIIEEDKLLGMSRWRSISEIPDFPFKSFGDLQQAVAEGRCYVSVDKSSAHRFAHLFNGPVTRALDTLLSLAPIFVAIASVIAAISFRNAWFVIGVPAALIGFVVGGSVHNLLRSILAVAPRDPSVQFPVRFTARILLAVMPFGTAIGILLFGGLLLSSHGAAAWTIASYLISVYAVDLFLIGVRSRSTLLQDDQSLFSSLHSLVAFVACATNRPTNSLV